MIHPELWENITSVEFDTLNATFPFPARLAEENDWSLEYSNAAIEEYKRFVYLAALSEQELLPSDEVNQVWLLHMTYTRHYWIEFRNILGVPLHHSPKDYSQMGQEQIYGQYAYTKRMYREEFGANPNPEFWPSEKDRFNAKQNFVRVDKSKNLVLEKPTMALPRSIGRFFGVAAFPLSVLGYAIAQSSGPVTGNLTTIGWMIVASIAVTIAVFGCLVWRMEHKARRLKKS